MEKPTNEKLLRLEIDNPLRSTDWRPLFERFGENERVAYETLRKQLNRVNGPIPLRMVRNSDLDSK